MEYEGDAYAVPFNTDTQVIFYNKTLFKEAGISEEQLPQTWEELETVARKLDVKNGDDFERIGFYPLWNLGADVWALNADDGVSWFDKDENVKIDTDNKVEALEWILDWQEYYGQDTINRLEAEFGSGVADPFISGLVAMRAQNINYYSSLAENAPDDFEFGVIQIPEKESGSGHWSWGGGFGRPTRRYPQTLQEHYRYFWEQDIAVDILTPEQDFSDYQLVIAPMLYLMTSETMAKLCQYTQAGGTLISSYFSGMVNETDLLYLGGLPQPLRALLGINVLELETLFDTEHNQLVFQGQPFETRDYSAIIEAETAEVLGEYQADFYQGTPAITKNAFGAGTAYYLAARTNYDFFEQFYASLVRELSLAEERIAHANPAVSIQGRISPERTYFFIMNFSEKEQTLHLIKEVVDLETNQAVPQTATLAPYEVRVVYFNN